MQVQLQQ